MLQSRVVFACIMDYLLSSRSSKVQMLASRINLSFGWREGGGGNCTGHYASFWQDNLRSAAPRAITNKVARETHVLSLPI